MRSVDNLQHSLRQLRLIDELDKRSEIKGNELFFLLSEGAKQGLALFPKYFALVMLNYNREDALHFAEQRQQEWEAIVSNQTFIDLSNNDQLVNALYALENPYFERGSENPSVIIIIFTTIFNNFYVSNLALLALLRELGVSILILKDPSRCYYLNGISKFGHDLPASVEALRLFLSQQGIERVYISGFSSSGYSSLLMTTLLPCQGYLGFSIRSDLSDNSSLHPGKFFTTAVRNSTPESLRMDLALILSEALPSHPYRLVYGSEDLTDKVHAERLGGIRNVTLSEIKGCGHHTISSLLRNGTLLAEFQSIIS